MAKKSGAVFFSVLTLGVFFALLIHPDAAASGAKTGLLLCAGVIIPSLFPFMVAGNLMLELKLPLRLGKALSPLTRRVFGVSGAGSTAFFLGLCGGYPLGAICASELYSKASITKKEAERLLGFCNNSSPAFIISVAGVTVFGSLKIGLFLYAVHLIAAIATGVLLRGKAAPDTKAPIREKSADFAAAFTLSVRRAASTMVTICGFVVFFSVLVGLIDANGGISIAAGGISARFGTELHFSRSLLTGILELGTGTSAMLGLSRCAKNLALCAFLIGWGGLSVHAQTAAVIIQGGLSPMKHTFGKLLHGLLSALITLFAYPVIF